MGCCNSKKEVVTNNFYMMNTQDFSAIVDWEESLEDEKNFDILCNLIKQNITIKLTGKNIEEAQQCLDILVEEFSPPSRKDPST